MYDRNQFSPLPPPGDLSAGRYGASYGQTDPRRRALLRRLKILLVAGVVAFAVTTWLLVRVEEPFGLAGLLPGPESTVRAHLQALNRGDLRGAYELFSNDYREQFPFEAYQQLVVTHRPMFRTQGVELTALEDSGERTVLDARMRATDGQQYAARFTMVLVEGRWWIDDVRWGRPSNRRVFAT